MSARRLAAPAVLVALAVLAALPGLGTSFWIDEVMTADTAALPLGSLLTRVGFGDVHPPLHYLLLGAWSRLAGGSDLALRLPSLAFAVLTTLLVHARARRLDEGPALLAGLLVATSTFHAHYAAEARSYALLTFLVLAATLAWERFLERPSSSGRLAAFVSAQALALLTHALAFPVLALLLLHGLVSGPRDPASRARIAFAHLAVLAAFSPWAPLFAVQSTRLPEAMTAHLRETVPLDLALSALGPAPAAPWPLLGPAAGLALVLLAASGLRRLPRPVPEGPPPAAAPSRIALALLPAAFALTLLPLAALPLSETLADVLTGALPVAWALLGAWALTIGLAAVLAPRLPGPFPVSAAAFVLAGFPALLLLASFARPVLQLRSLLPLVPLLAFAAAAGAARFRRGPLVASAIALALAVPSLFRHEVFEPRQDLRGLASRLADSPAPRLLVLPPWDAPGLARYLPASAPAPEPFLEPEAMPGPRDLPDRVDLVLTRASALPGSPARTAVLRHLDGYRPVSEATYPGIEGGLRLVRLERGEPRGGPRPAP